MLENRVSPGIEKRLRMPIVVIGIAGAAWLAYLAQGLGWGASPLLEMGLFALLIVVTGSFPMPVGPGVKVDITSAVMFGSVLVLEPGEAALAAVAGRLGSNLLIRFWGDELHLPGYKYPFYKYPLNLTETALSVGLAAVVFHALATGDGVLTPAVVPAVAVMYMVNTALISLAAGLELGISPLRIWWRGTQESGLAELSLFAFGFLGAVAYRESPWTVVALFIPVAIIYIAFSRLARANSQLEQLLERLEAMQGRIVSTSKLASVGAISLDLAHQIKNPLAILLGRLEGLQDGLEKGSRGRRHLDIAMEAGWRIQELTQTFASIGQQKWVQLDICESLDEAFGMAGLRNRKNVETRRDYERGTLHVKGNPVLIREALSNIFSNAMEAVDDEGVITIGASQVNGSVVVRISDNGPGIPHQQMAHLFEPFRTTKPNGHGLGLFAARHILEMHEGSVEIESEEGEGTRVTLRLPAAPSPDAAPEAEDLQVLRGSVPHESES